MKRFGLKAIAATMALLMTAGLSAPAATEAADDKLVTSAAGKALVITQDMVDSEGEFVLSGENFEKVVLPSDVEIKNLYVDGCEIGEFIVEGGNNPKVQLWDVQIKNVTVSAADIIDENKAIVEYLDIMKGKESTEEFDVDKFLQEVRENNERLSSLVPEIRLMGADMESSKQEIGALTLAGNAKVNVSKGNTPGELNVAFNSAQSKMDVTIEGYKGDINVDQATAKDVAFGILNIKTKKSEIENVNVKAQGNTNIALRSSDSKATNVNFDGGASAMLTVAAPVDNLKVAESASNATVKVLTPLISADVQGKSVTLNLGPAASVETATIAGSGNVVSGSGDLQDCTIEEGCTASVQIPGAAVTGDNTYQPIISSPSVGSGSVGDSGNGGSGEGGSDEGGSDEGGSGNGGSGEGGSDEGGSGEQAITEFNLVVDEPFSGITTAEGKFESTKLPLNGTNFADKLPDSLKSNAAIYEAFQSVAGIREYVKEFVFTCTLTEATAKGSGNGSWAPQMQPIIQDINYAGFYDVMENVGEPSVAGTAEATITMTAIAETWEEFSQLYVQVVDAAPETPIAGTFSVKVVLNDIPTSTPPVEEEIKEFNLVVDEPFSGTTTAEGKFESTKLPLNGTNFADKLPDSLKSNAAIYEAFQSVAGIREYVKEFVFSYTLTEATAKGSGNGSWAPQMQPIIQDINYAGFYDITENVGEPGVAGSAESTIAMTAISETWEEFSQLYVQVVDAAPETPIAGTFSVKVVLK